MKIKFRLEILIFLSGIILLFINIIGIFTSLRNSDIYTEKKVAFKDEVFHKFQY